MLVCSNHFKFGKPLGNFNYPTMYLTQRDAETKKTPVKRKDRGDPLFEETSLRRSPRRRPITELFANTEQHIPKTLDEFVFSLGPEYQLQQITRDYKVQFYTGFEGAKMFKLVFDHLLPIACRMQYWKGQAQTEREQQKDLCEAEESLMQANEETFRGFMKRPGPKRKLSLELELLMVMMRLKCNLKVQDLAYRFDVAIGLVTTVVFTWVRLMALELKPLIKWPDRAAIRRYMPDGFRKFYPKCRVIIDCTEIFLETPSCLQLAATCWSQYKHHHTIKFLVGITPNGAISFVSDCYGGRASDIFITENCGFASGLLPNDQVMADRGFKIEDYLAYYQCTLTIPPSTQGNFQMNKSAVARTSQVANLRIFVEKAIRRMKEYNILKNELPIILLPICDDIVTVCAALTNLKKPLLEQ
eukprot:gene2805-biopygen2313